MQDELRIYSVRPGSMENWLREWTARIRPLREKLGFTILGHWVVDGQDEFVWILRYSGPNSYEAANRSYYESPERKALDPDPARHLVATAHRLMTPVE
jgi:hypothetical protein